MKAEDAKDFEKRLAAYFAKIGRLGEIASLTLLTDGNSSNHLNYKVTTSEGVVYVARVGMPGNVLDNSNLADEYLILKKVEKNDIAPKAYAIDLERFEVPLLIEEYIDGSSFTNLSHGDEVQFAAAIETIVAISNITITQDEFPFKSSYATYAANLRMWEERLKEISKSSKEGRVVAQHMKSLADEAGSVLEKNESLLAQAPVEFIYNDVHKGNLFWIPAEEKAKFIDWQKVSLGDPSFMAALFVRRFADLWGMTVDDFKKKVLAAYAERKQVPNFDELLMIRMLERSVADMIWTNWAKVRRGEPVLTIEKNTHHKEALELLSQF